MANVDRQLNSAASRVLGHVWIECPERALPGIGRVRLLEQIHTNRFISAARRALYSAFREFTRRRTRLLAPAVEPSDDDAERNAT